MVITLKKIADQCCTFKVRENTAKFLLQYLFKKPGLVECLNGELIEVEA